MKITDGMDHNINYTYKKIEKKKMKHHGNIN